MTRLQLLGPSTPTAFFADLDGHRWDRDGDYVTVYTPAALDALRRAATRHGATVRVASGRREETR